jgi:hypothetical protein
VSTSTRWRAHATPAVVLGALLLALTAAAVPFVGGPAGRPVTTTARAVLAALPPTGTAPAGRAASTGAAGRPAGTAGAGPAGLRTAGARSDDAAAPQRGHSPQHWGLLALGALLLTGLGPALRRPGRRSTSDRSRPRGTASRGPPLRALPPAVPCPA